MPKTFRPYKPQDCKEIVKLFYDTVHTINSKDYNSAQLDVWAPEKTNMDMWNKSLSSTHTVVVEIMMLLSVLGIYTKPGTLTGFLSIKISRVRE